MNAPRLYCRCKALVAAALAVNLLAGIALADPLPGRDVPKFSQKPMVATPIVGGSDAYLKWLAEQLTTND